MKKFNEVIDWDMDTHAYIYIYIIVINKLNP